MNPLNLHDRCNLAARRRWDTEENNNKEKHQGYQGNKCFSKSWEAAKGYHLLMRIGHLINEIIHHTKNLVKKVKKYTIRGFVKYVFETLKTCNMDMELADATMNPDYRHKLE